MSYLDEYKEAPEGQELEFSVQAMFDETAPLDRIVQTNFDRGFKPYSSTVLEKHFENQSIIDKLPIVGSIYKENNVKERGGGRSPVEHLHKGLKLGEILGFETNTLLKYMVHDLLEDIAKNPKHMNELMNNNPITNKLGLTPDIATAAVALSDNHMFIAKYLRDITTLQYGGIIEQFKNIKPQQIEKEFEKMLDKKTKTITNHRLRRTIEEVRDAYRKSKENMTGSEALRMINQNEIGYPPYIERLHKHLRYTLNRRKKSYEKNVNEAMSTLVAKAIDGLHNAMDVGAMDSLRRARRLLVKTPQILRLLNLYDRPRKDNPKESLMNDRLEYLYHTLMEVHLNQLNNYHEFLNIPKTNDENTIRNYLEEMEEKKNHNPRALGYKDLETMRLHEALATRLLGKDETRKYQKKMNDFKEAEKPITFLEQRLQLKTTG